jgi:hypothetical protein
MPSANAECKMHTVMPPVSAFGILHLTYRIQGGVFQHAASAEYRQKQYWPEEERRDRKDRRV